jgi:hypothetical protein
MGYYIDASSLEWVVPESAEVLEKIKEMPKRMKRIQRGGGYGPNGKQESWFSWVNDNTILEATTVESVFSAFGFETMKVEGGFEITGYSSKIGQEELLLAVVAPFCADGSYIEWRGEDGEEWKYEIIKGKMMRSNAEKQWDKPVPYQYWHYGSVGEWGKDYRSYSVNIDIDGDIDAQVEAAEAEATQEPVSLA